MILNIKGYNVIIDDKDYEEVAKIDWHILSGKGKVYFRKSKYLGKNKRKTILLHRYIIKAPVDMEVDHINSDTLDNRKSNLRICKRSENAMNRKPNKSKTGYKGVHFRKDRGKYTAQIRKNYKIYFLGYFNTPEEAYKAYCEASKKYHGEYGRIA
jgi:hypothetical protein